MLFFSSWFSLFRIVAVGVPLYLGLVVFLRISGKRTLSKMNAFDLVVTVALGSILATSILSKQSVLAEGLTAFALLIALQFLITWSSLRSPWFRRLVKNRPRILALRGELHPEAMRHERITKGELDAAIRASGFADVESIYAVIIETDGSLSVIPRREDQHGRSSLAEVAGLDDEASGRRSEASASP